MNKKLTLEQRVARLEMIMDPNDPHFTDQIETSEGEQGIVLERGTVGSLFRKWKNKLTDDPAALLDEIEDGSIDANEDAAVIELEDTGDIVILLDDNWAYSPF